MSTTASTQIIPVQWTDSPERMSCIDAAAHCLAICRLVRGEGNYIDKAAFAKVESSHWAELFIIDDKGLRVRPQIGMGATLCGYSDRYPYEIVKVVNDRCLDVREMNAVGGLKPDADVRVGGFCAHVVDQHSAQQWTLSSNPSAPIIRIRLHRNGSWKDAEGRRFTVGKAMRFYDYNF